MTESNFPERFADALVDEIKAELGRQSMSSRALGRLIGKSSQYMSDRLDGGNSKTGKRVMLNVWDLAAFALALNISEVTLVERAEAVAHGRVVRLPFGGEPSSAAQLDEVAAESFTHHPDESDADFDGA